MQREWRAEFLSVQMTPCYTSQTGMSAWEATERVEKSGFAAGYKISPNTRLQGRDSFLGECKTFSHANGSYLLGIQTSRKFFISLNEVLETLFHFLQSTADREQNATPQALSFFNNYQINIKSFVPLLHCNLSLIKVCNCGCSLEHSKFWLIWITLLQIPDT